MEYPVVSLFVISHFYHKYHFSFFTFLLSYVANMSPKSCKQFGNLFDRLALCFLHYVRIRVHRDRDIAMPQDLTHYLWLHALSEQEACATMSQIVEPYVGKPGLSQNVFEVPS